MLSLSKRSTNYRTNSKKWNKDSYKKNHNLTVKREYKLQYKLKIIKLRFLKVSKFQNEFLKSSFLPKYQQKVVRIVDCVVRAEILTIFCSYFGRNDDFINPF